jgi:hypothetical protein
MVDPKHRDEEQADEQAEEASPELEHEVVKDLDVTEEPGGDVRGGIRTPSGAQIRTPSG